MQEKSRSGLGVLLSGIALIVAGSSAQAGGLGLCCSCPPPLTWCSEQAPCLKFKCACPRPVCDPCDLQHYGYYATCWQPWPFQPDWSHCSTIPPGAALPPPAYPPYSPRAPQDRRPDTIREEDLPKPRPKDQMDNPQVRNTGYRVGEQPYEARVAPTQQSAPILVPVPQTQVPVQQVPTSSVQPSAPETQLKPFNTGVRFIR